jgi:hypothetical protein
LTFREVRLTRLLLMLGIAAFAAIALPVLILPFAGPAQAARVIFLAEPDVSLLPDGVTIDRWTGSQAVLAGVDARAARALYLKGAVLVYPIRSAGCLSLSGG